MHTFQGSLSLLLFFLHSLTINRSHFWTGVSGSRRCTCPYHRRRPSRTLSPTCATYNFRRICSFCILSGTSAGVGFAIPSSTVLKIVPQLIQFGKVVRAGLNSDIAPDLIANQLNVRNGALILQVPGNSLAAKAGLVPTTRGFAGNIILGDVIVAVDDKPVKNKAGLEKVLDDYSVGDRVVLRIQRGSENLELPIILEEKN